MSGPPWVIVGMGRVGRALQVLAEELGVEVAATWTRADSVALDSIRDRLQGAAVFVTVSDDAIGEVAEQLARIGGDPAFVVHCSGSLSSGVLSAAGLSTPVGSVHPLLAIAEPHEAVAHMAKTAWTIEGDDEVLQWARGWLAKLGVQPAQISPEHKALYHAAAVSSAGLVVALIDAAFAMAEAASISPKQARSMLLPLARSTLDNLETHSPAQALTGPVARGDEDVIEGHRAALAELQDENLLEVYDALTRRSRTLAATLKGES